MSRVVLTDESGHPVNLMRLDNGRFTSPAFNAETLNNSTSIKMRDGEILLCSYAKSGCHWVWQNIRLMTQGHITLDKVDKDVSMIEENTIADLDGLPCPRLINCHLFFHELPADVLKGKVKVIFLYRNPKDIATSLYHHHKRLPHYKYKGSFSNFLKLFTEGQVSNDKLFQFWRGWEEGLRQNPQIPCHVCCYEDFKLHPVPERRRLAKFLGLPELTDKFLQEVEQATDIEVMRRLKGPKNLDPEGRAIFYRKGQVGDWRNHFTVQENELFDKLVEAQLADCKMFNFTYSVDTS